MNEATICGRHGIHLDRVPGTDGALRHALGEPADLLLATVAVLLDVYDDGADVVFTATKDDVRDVLKRTQRFATASDDEPSILALNVDDSGVVSART